MAMATIIYYFTGTGNSLAVAKAVAERVPETSLVGIPRCMFAGEKVHVPKDANVGIVYPLYCGGLPNIVVRFFGLLDLSQAGYVFSIVTEGGKMGSPTKQIGRLCEASGHALNAAWWVQMPDNYIPLSAPPEKSVQKTLREDAVRKVSLAAEAVNHRTDRMVSMSIPGKIMTAAAYGMFMRRIPEFDRKFTINPVCNGCMTCVEVCPVNNIRALEKGKKEWLHHCEGCLACLQFCPVEAISCGGKTENRPRYHHANATARDMMEQKGLR
ncbi:MAG: EFR1 family ferrodoxin [Methanocorpusculum sp.]|nr:EFR1 family ferrodoxin [Methanocorpusculum sp.]